ncbi:accessory gene regulator B family protein [Anaerorhabdus sp.]|uniref:accessory gene regulator B family protein n=1 Tax=Anaerorhabdus sp. TaxID=1872524 RepID=UPI002FC690CA
MIENVGTKLGKYFFNKGYIEEDDIDAVRYYVEVFFNEYFQLLITIFIGYFISQFKETILYLIFFVAIRKYSGGYHAKTLLMCNLISYLLYFCGLFFNECLSINFLIPILFISFLYLWIKGSVYSSEQIEFKFMDKQTKKLRIVLLILLILCLLYQQGQYLGLLSIVIVQVVLMNIVKERRIEYEVY